MKKFNLLTTILLLSFFTCFSFAVPEPIYNGEILNIITNLDEYLKDYYIVVECGDIGCDGNGSFNIVKENIKYIPGWGNVYLIPNDIEFESLELMERGRNERHLNDKRDIRIGMLYDKSTKGDLTCIYEIIRDSEWIQYNDTGIKLQLINEYEGYNTGYINNESNTEENNNTQNNNGNNKDNSRYQEGNQSEKLANGFTREFNNSYKFAFRNGITTMNDISKADMNGPLTRIAMAKMLSNYAINILGKKPANKVVPKFPDVDEQLNEDYGGAVDLAYQLGIMGIGIDKFRPYDLVNRGEFGTALSRMLFGTPDGEGAYYEPHLKTLKERGIITNDDPNLGEKRGYVMTMLMRSAI